MRLLIGVFVIGALALVALFLYRTDNQGRAKSRNESEPEKEMLRFGDLEFLPSSESRARAELALPAAGSEDKSSLLIRPQIEVSASQPEDERDYGPNAEVEWIVDIEFEENRMVATEAIDAAFGSDWLTEVSGAVFYGYSPDEGRWTYLHAAGVPSRWTSIAVTKDLVTDYEEESAGSIEASLSGFFASVQKNAAVLDPRAVLTREPVAEAAGRALRYLAIGETVAADAILILAAPNADPFAGEQVWDVMYSLGLRWGNMDIFHWENHTEEGDDSFFSVWTTTEPGYFLPELVAAGQVRAESLVFGFSVPRSVAPAHVYRQMLAAAKYAQERLGGVLLSDDGELLDEAKAIAEIEDTVAILLDAGIHPGSEVALRVF